VSKRGAARYEGWFTRLECEECGEMFEIEDDVSNGQIVECDACGAELEVVRYGV
jgi:lysine biosynthesis protein LysW